MSTEKIIYHIDVNSAFLSWSAAHRIMNNLDRNDLRDVPSVVGGSEESRHGIVLAKSTPAKKYGIKTGEPLVDARSKCPGLVVIPPDYEVYVDSSRSLVQMLKAICPVVEQYSIDECWVDMTGTERLYGYPVVVAEALREKIRKELGFTVNIGISSNKLLAKMASDFKKPNRVHTLFPEEIPRKMWPLPVSDLFFVGRATTKKLFNLGIFTIGDLANTELKYVKDHFMKHGEVIWNFANGFDMNGLQPVPKRNKGYGNSTTVPFDVKDSNTGKMVLLSLCEMVGMRLRKDEVKVSCLAVSLTSNEFYHTSHQMQLFSQTNVTEEIYKAACTLFDQMWDTRTPIRQMGVHTSKVREDNNRQYNLFDMDKYEKYEKLDNAIDFIREKYGEDSIFRANFLNSKLEHLAGGTSKEKRSGITKPV